MIPRLRSLLVAATASILFACAYFNGLYNANHLASDAEKAEREGRVGEARSLWSQAAVKAESVATRYPESGYRDDALLLQGRALQATGDCARATVALETAVHSSSDSVLRNKASLILGQCYVYLAEYESAIDVLTPVAEATDTLWSIPARLWRGKALFRSGRNQEAITDLKGADVGEAALDLSMAYSAVGRTAYARSTLDGVVYGPYDELRWHEALDSLGRKYPGDASAIVDVLVEREDLSEGERARLLLAEGQRWADRGLWDQAAVHFGRSAQIAPDSVDGLDAAVRRVLARIRAVEVLDDLAALADSLGHAVESESSGSLERATYLEIARGSVRALRASSVPTASGSGHPDLEVFLRAEEMRDYVGAFPLAAAMFRHVAEAYPSSAIAPKSLMAAAQLDAPRADSLLFVLRTEYATSPYALLLKGIAGDRYSAIEDSLRTLTAGMRRTLPREN